MDKNLYEGLKVLDVTNNYAGPMAGSLMADYGAEVWHIEKPVYGDDNRFFPPMFDGISINYCTNNRGKKSIVLNLKDPKGREAFKKLAQEADVLLESYRPGVMDKLGLGYEELKKINPELIYCSISAYGQVGPYATRPGYDVIAQAVSGLMEVTGEPDGMPTKIGPAIGDWIGAMNAFGCIGTALYHRAVTGKGQHIDISLVRALLWMAAKMDHKVTGGPMQTRTGNHHSNLAPYGVFKGNNGETIVIGVLSAKLWDLFCKTIGKPELVADPRFVSNDKRVENKAAMIELIEDWLKTFEHISDAAQLLMDAGIPCAKIYNMKDIENDPHYKECGWIADMPMADGMTSLRTRPFPTNPFGFSGFAPEYKKAPALGEHNHEILESLGYTAEEIDEMEQRWEDEVKGKK